MKKVLFVGLDPATVYFSDPGLPPGMTAEKVHAGIKVALDDMAVRGWNVVHCFIKPDASGAGGKDCFHIALMQKPADAKLPVAARLTLTGGAAPVETEITLGAGAKL